MVSTAVGMRYDSENFQSPESVKQSQLSPTSTASCICLPHSFPVPFDLAQTASHHVTTEARALGVYSYRTHFRVSIEIQVKPLNLLFLRPHQPQRSFVIVAGHRLDLDLQLNPQFNAQSKITCFGEYASSFSQVSVPVACEIKLKAICLNFLDQSYCLLE